jgi:TPP-dependent 2-oxoacid decarboxylase
MQVAGIYRTYALTPGKGGYIMVATATVTLGSYLATRLEQVGLRHYFGIPGDYNLALFDQILANPNLACISCCNELNAGYAADGYARAHGAAAMLVTYSVGALSAVNATAGHYAEDLPVILISGGPNTHSESENQILHHSLGEVRYGYVREMFAPVTAAAVIIRHPEEAPRLIDQTIAAALNRRKPVYLEIACNIAALEIPAPRPYQLWRKPTSNPETLQEAVDQAAALLNAAIKPVAVGGVKLRPAGAVAAFRQFIDASGYAVAMMPNAKGFFPEEHPNFVGIYWGPVSSPGTEAIVESADAYLFAGPVLSDYASCGHTIEISPKKLLHVGADFVQLPGALYQDIVMDEFLVALASKIKRNGTSLASFNRTRTQTRPEPPVDRNAPLRTRRLFAMIQGMLDAHTTLIAETGDSWFNCMNLALPQGSAFEIQMQYGSIGWAVGAALGYQLAVQPARRVIACIGDGSFQMTAQELSTMIRYGLRPIIFILNNGGYTIEVEIHDGPYNVIKNWNYAGLVPAFNGPDGNGWSCQVRTEGEAQDAIHKALAHDGLSVIEAVIDKDDCSRDLLEWGTRVCASNARPYKPVKAFG